MPKKALTENFLLLFNALASALASFSWTGLPVGGQYHMMKINTDGTERGHEQSLQSFSHHGRGRGIHLEGVAGGLGTD